MAASYFIRFRGQMVGPFTREQMLFRARSGELSTVHMVSENQTDWVPAREWGWLFGQKMASAVVPPPLPASMVVLESPAAAVSAATAHAPIVPPADRVGHTQPLPAVTNYWMAISISLLLIALTGLGAALYVKYRPGLVGVASSAPGSAGGGSQATPLSRDDASARAVTSARDAGMLAEALGLVVCGAEVTAYDGTRFEVVESSGSGFFISQDGFMLTNRHVVDSYIRLSRAELLKRDAAQNMKVKIAEQLWVFVNRRKLVASVAYISPKYDMAILKVSGATFSRIFRLKSADDAELDSDVRAVGFPAVGDPNLSLSDAERLQKAVAGKLLHADVTSYFSPRDFEFVLTAGRISRSLKDDAASVFWIQHNADINHGNSGGPLISLDGVVFGINTLGFSDRSQSGMFYSLPLRQLREEVERNVKGTVWVN